MQDENRNEPRPSGVPFALLGLGLLFTYFLAAAFRGPGVDRDFLVYDQAYQLINAGYAYSVDFSYHLVSRFMNEVGLEFRGVIVFYAAMGILFKWIGLKRSLQFKGIFLALFIAIYGISLFPLYDMTQIRAGWMLALGMIWMGTKSKRAEILLVILMIVIHYSALLLLVSYLGKWIYGRLGRVKFWSVSAAGFALVFIFSRLLLQSSLSKVSALGDYAAATADAGTVGALYLLSPKLLIVLAILMAQSTSPIWLSDRADLQVMKRFQFLVGTSAYLFALLCLADVPAAGFRVLEIGIFYSLVLVVYLLNCGDRRWFVWVLAVLLPIFLAAILFVFTDNPLLNLQAFNIFG